MKPTGTDRHIVNTREPAASVAPTPEFEALDTAIAREGYAFITAPRFREILLRHGSLSDWDTFADSWGDLKLDPYLKDGGRYRERRFAVYACAPDRAILRQPHAPHYQSLDYNRLYGGIQRWFEPVTETIGACHSMMTVLQTCRFLFDALAGVGDGWHIEAHQFRILALGDQVGLPTPEGLHRDGVDYVLVLMVRRHNIRSGTTSIHALDGHELGSFTLTQPFDAALVEDARVYHGVTAVEPLDPQQAAFRDVLVVTFRRSSGA